MENPILRGFAGRRYLNWLARRSRRTPKTGVVNTNQIGGEFPDSGVRGKNPRRHVSAKHRTTEEWKDASLLERRREPAARQRSSRPAPRALPRRDQLLASRSLAKGDRSVRRGCGTVAFAGAVSGGSLRGPLRRCGPPAAQPNAALRVAAVGRVLARGRAAERPAARSLLGRAPAEKPQEHAMGSQRVGLPQTLPSKNFLGPLARATVTIYLDVRHILIYVATR